MIDDLRCFNSGNHFGNIKTMPFKFAFQESITNLNTYYFISHEKTIVDINWAPLFSTWQAPTLPLEEYLCPTEHRAEIATYLGFAWDLSQGFDRFVIPNHYRNDVARKTGLPYHHVNWQYQAEPNWDGNIVINEVQSKSNIRKSLFKNWFAKRIDLPPKIAGWQSVMDKGGVFQIKTLMELANLHLATTSDAASEISLFCLKPNRVNDLVTMLRDSQKPDLAKFLVKDELFIHIQLGIDLGYSDCILVKSLSTVSTGIYFLAQRYEQAVSDYERDCQKFPTLEQALIRLKELAQGKAAG